MCADRPLPQRSEPPERAAEDPLQASDDRYRSVVDAAHNVILCLDPAGRVLEWNRAAERLYGWRRDQVLGESYLERFLPEDVRSAVAADIARVLAGATTEGFENAVETQDGERWLSWNVSPLVRSDGRSYGIVAVGQDITERRQADRRLATYQERLRSLASQLALAEERERRRLADELHDRIGQTLGLARLKLSALRSAPSSSPPAAGLDEVAALIDQASRDARSLLYELSPPILYDLGFAAAAEWLMEQQGGATRFVFSEDGRPKPLDEALELILFRALRELVLNVAKHARARRCAVSFDREGDEVRLEVDDDGVGFRPRAGARQEVGGGFGLFSIREQLRRLGGRIEIDSQPGAGTRVRLWVPLARRPGP